jgi:protein TonB
MRYPEIAIEREIQGIVTLRLKIEKDGSVSSVSVVGSLSPECDREAVRVVKTLGRFISAIQQGKPVAVWYTLPVRFQIP